MLVIFLFLRNSDDYLSITRYIYIYIYTPGQKYKTILKNEEKDIVYNFQIMKIRYIWKIRLRDIRI